MPGETTLGGLHHVTAITGDAAGNVAFYTRVLGLRLVKKTVNQDDVSAYHLFYGDDEGHPGTEVTFFDWPSASPNVPGCGSVGAIALAVPGPEAFAWWEKRLTDLGVRHGPATAVDGRATLAFTDPEGQRLELVDAGVGVRPDVRPWGKGPVPAEVALRGTYAVTVEVAAPAPTLALLTNILGFRQTGAYTDDRGAAVTLLECGPGGSGALVRVAVPRLARRGAPGVGGVHHVAFRTADAPTQDAWHTRLRATGLPLSPIVDRYYFRSIYFREPGGTLFEIATDGPGFATDESPEHLGEGLSLPPFLEPQRATIEAGLRPLETAKAPVGSGAPDSDV